MKCLKLKNFSDNLFYLMLLKIDYDLFKKK